MLYKITKTLSPFLVAGLFAHSGIALGATSGSTTIANLNLIGCDKNSSIQVSTDTANPKSLSGTLKVLNNSNVRCSQILEGSFIAELDSTGKVVRGKFTPSNELGLVLGIRQISGSQSKLVFEGGNSLLPKIEVQLGFATQSIKPIVPAPIKSKPLAYNSSDENIVSPAEVVSRIAPSITNSVSEAQKQIDDIQSRIVMFITIRELMAKKPLTRKEKILGTIDSEINRLTVERNALQQTLTARYSTPIRPTNSNLSTSAFRAADTFPKVPYYVPGTNEFGELLIIPRVSDVGELFYEFNVIDPTGTFEKVRDRIEVEHKDIQSFIDGLYKIDEWTDVAQANGISRRVEKTSACIPSGFCDKKSVGKASTEVLFQVYEDGSTSGRIQRNKGLFVTGYNMSVESSILLAAYLEYMKEVGSKEFNIGVMSDAEVKDLFK